MSVVIRRASTEDVPELMELEAALFDNAMSETTLERELVAGEGYLVRQWHESSAILGYILVREDGDLLDITRLGVRPEAQCLGLGTTLLKYILDRERTTVLTVKKGNARALRLYKRHGFVVVGHFIEARAWVLRRDARPAAPTAP